MEYIIELFFDLKKVKNITLTKEILIDLAHNSNCSMQYFIHEVDGHSRIIDNNTCIYYINFSQENFNNLINLIQIIRENKSELFKNVIIDCIYEDGDDYNMIYSSQNYIRLINKTNQEKIKLINKFNKLNQSNLTNDYHKQILQALNS
jgi:hypothetical protein